MLKRFLVILLLTIQCTQSCFTMEAELVPLKPGLLSAFYGLFLGNEDVDAKYTQLAHEALRQLGDAHPSTVAIKQMNAVGPALALQDLLSFTAFGVWLNQKYLNSLDNNALKFLIYHEVSHYIQKHHQKTIVTCVLSLLFLIAELFLLQRCCCSIHPAAQITVLVLAALVSILAWYRFFLPRLVKRQEKQADLIAAKALIDAGAQHIVDAHIAKLKASKNSGEGDLWWYSDEEIAKYLEDLKNVLTHAKTQ